MAKFQVFVSSTYIDLVAERRAVFNTLLTEKYIPQGMELFPPTDESLWELIKSLIEESDYYLVVIGQRYGTIFPKAFTPDPVKLQDERMSYTWLEYEYAQHIGKPTIALFFNGETHPGRDQDPALTARLQLFKERISGYGRGIAYWRDEASLVLAVTAGLKDLIEKSPSQGWVRGPRIIQPKRKPFRVTLLGPLTGEDAPFGWSQARSVLAALMRILPECCGERWESHEEYFSLGLVDTERDGPSENDDYALLKKDFAAAQHSSRVIFGPMDSDEVRALFYDSGEGKFRLSEAKLRDLKAYTILTTAATEEVRRARGLSDKLIQLSPNAEVYAQHLVQFAATCFTPSIERIVLLHQKEREYGQSIARALRNYVGDHNLRLIVRCYERFLKHESLSDQAGRLIESICSDGPYNNKQTLLVIAETGETLRAIARAARSQAQFLISTMTSLDDSVLREGDLDGSFVISSFAPALFSLNTRDFMKFVDRAQNHWSGKDVKSPGTPGATHKEWSLVNAVDAETHDAAVHWFITSGLSGIRDLRHRSPGRLYVTNFFVAGDGSSGENRAALYALRVQDGRLIPAVF